MRNHLESPTHAHRLRRFAICFLTLEGLGGLAWWVGLAASPTFRSHFRPADAPDSTLLAFAPGDLMLFVGAGLLAAVGLARRSRWAWPVLVAHTAVAGYAAFYCLTLTLITGGDAWLAAVLMAPSLVVLPVLVWLSCPRETGMC